MSADAQLLATGDEYSGLQFWQLPAVQRIGQRIPFSRSSPTGGTIRRELARLVFTESGRSVLHADAYGNVSLWDVPQRVDAKASHMRDWVTAFTGLQVNKTSQLEALDLKTWQQRQLDLVVPKTSFSDE